MTQRIDQFANPRTKLAGRGTEGDPYRVSRNNEDISEGSGAFFNGSTDGTVIPIDQLDDVIRALQAVKEDYAVLAQEEEEEENNLTIAEYLLTQPKGTTFVHKDATSTRTDLPILIGQGEYVFNSKISSLDTLLNIKRRQYDIITPTE